VTWLLIVTTTLTFFALFLIFGMSLRIADNERKIKDLEERLAVNDRLLQASLTNEIQYGRFECRDDSGHRPPD
jgi:hypothetical protein